MGVSQKNMKINRTEATAVRHKKQKQIPIKGRSRSTMYVSNTRISSSGTRSTKAAQDNAKQDRNYIPPLAGIGMIKSGRRVKQGTEP